MTVHKISVILSKHCKARAFERQITTQNIRKIVNNPEDTIYDDERQNYKIYGEGDNPPFKDQPYLVAIHSKTNTSVTVITVMWADKAGLKAIGFNKIR